MSTKIAERLQHLRTLINHHNHLYYVVARPEIADSQYNALFEKLLQLEAEYPEYAHPNSPTQRVGSDITNRFPRAAHPFPMLSVKSFYTPDTIVTIVPNVPLFAQPKLDGIAIELIYSVCPPSSSKGDERSGGGFFQLLTALTRGNGNHGEDVTPNARTIKSIPLTLPTTSSQLPAKDCLLPTANCLLVVRGEIFITARNLKSYNRLRAQSGQQPINCQRSAAVSLLKANTTAKAAAGKLSACFFDFWYIGQNGTPHRANPADFPELPVIQQKQVQPAEIGALTTAAAFPELSQQGIPTDGLIIRTATGDVVCAYKPNSPVFETSLLFISQSTGKTGKVTPIAHFAPFSYNGADFSKASLISPENAKALNLAHGQRIRIQLTGGINPAVISSLPTANCQLPAFLSPLPTTSSQLPASSSVCYSSYFDPATTNQICQTVGAAYNNGCFTAPNLETLALAAINYGYHLPGPHPFAIQPPAASSQKPPANFFQRFKL